MGAMSFEISSLTAVYSTVYSGAGQRKHQSSASLAFVTGEFPAQMASNAENVSIWWRHHDFTQKRHILSLEYMRDNEKQYEVGINLSGWNNHIHLFPDLIIPFTALR